MLRGDCRPCHAVDPLAVAVRRRTPADTPRAALCYAERVAKRASRGTFRSTLFRIPGPGGWVFAPVPPEHAPPATEPWGRVPVTATVDGATWDTSVWHDKKRGPLLAVPKRVRKQKDDGDVVTVTLAARTAGRP